MKIFYFILLSSLMCHTVFGQPEDVWQPLFDGRSLDGWSIVDPPAKVMVEDSSIVLSMTAYTSRHAFVRTNKPYRDFIFEVEFKRDLTIDSGILFRCENTPDTAFSRLFGYMIKVDPSLTRLWTGGVFLDYGNGITWLHDLEGDDRARHAEYPGGEWNRLRVEAVGEVVKIWMNDIPMVHMLDDKYQQGYIAFKIHYLMHDKEQESLEIAYRKARIITTGLEKFVREIDLPRRDTRSVKEIKYFR
jgi:hypothetical protein